MIKLKNIFYKITFILIVCFSFSHSVYAESAEEIEIGVDATLERFSKEVSGGEKYLKKAHGVLIFPSVIKAGFVVGGEYGEGALRVNGKTVEYYSTAAASLGFQLGAQSKSVVLVFLTKKALANFRNSEGWKAGVDGSVAIVEWGVGEDINNVDITDPIAGFVFSNKGLMYNLTLEGSKFSKLVK
ncbi:MAG: YSC84-related protein [Gammaproteobacteria bacterium]